MTKRMLIDATHPEETRVVVLDGSRLEEFDVETSTKKQNKGNIYLARVVRVEPSLQAAFVDYGGNRHGFLAFGEIHPDYYQISEDDRRQLIAEQEARAAQENDEDDLDDDDEVGLAPLTEVLENQPDDVDADVLPTDEASGDDPDDGGPSPDPDHETVGDVSLCADDGVLQEGASDDAPDAPARKPARQEPSRARAPSRNWKIQDVIKRRQIVLVQVVKEERGNKGAALTTYISLAGRYCVFVPNTIRGGGISRKITNVADRRRLKAIMADLNGPRGSAIILRTAGGERSRAEIKRDHDYLLKTWETIRSTALNSKAPALLHEEGSLIKRAIRDIYSRDIEEVLVEGENGYRVASDFMQMLTPGHIRRVQQYKDDTMPLFHRYQVESQMDAMLSPIAQLKSGGYLVINQTEALVAIDVNSGRSTRERNIEETAFKTNLEAADEIARQLRLRDLAGLVVIDFIDMDDSKANTGVERRLKEALKSDRARIQVGHISSFGLLEMSRQRLRPSLMETSFQPCAHCRGTGMVRSVESTALYILRLVEEDGIRRRYCEITVTVPPEIALYILNRKRDVLATIEQKYNLRVYLEGDNTLIIPDHRMERVKIDSATQNNAVIPDVPVTEPVPAVSVELVEADPEDAPLPDEKSTEQGEAGAEMSAPSSASVDRKRRRRRRRRRPGEDVAANGDGVADADGAEGNVPDGEDVPEVSPPHPVSDAQEAAEVFLGAFNADQECVDHNSPLPEPVQIPDTLQDKANDDGDHDDPVSGSPETATDYAQEVQDAEVITTPAPRRFGWWNR